MKVLHTGNLVNNSYKLAKFSRRLGVDARLFIDAEQVGTGDDPAWEDPELARGYPDWIEVCGFKKEETLPQRAWAWAQRIRTGRRYVRENGIDIVHAQVTSPVFAQFFGARVLVTHCLGSDLREMAGRDDLKGRLLRRAYGNSKIIFFNNVDHALHLDRLGLTGEFLPNPYDLERFRGKGGKVRFEGHDFVVFHPARLDWTYRGGDRSSTKGNDRLIRAFAGFVEKSPGALLVMLGYGVDIEATVNLVGDLGIGSSVKFLDKMPKEELIETIHGADLIADQFDVGSFGGVALEAMACGKPLLTYLNEACAKRCYPELPPIYNCRTEEEILAALLDATRDDLMAAGEKNRDWMEKHHHWEVVERVVEAYERALGD